MSDLDAIAEGGNRFAINLYKALSNSSENVVVSPLSLQLILALTYCGAKDETAREIASVLQLPQSMDQILSGHQKLIKGLHNPVLKLATKMFLDNSFRIEPDFNKISNTYFLTDVKKEDFVSNPEESRQDINHWVEDKTNQKIKDLLPKGIISNITRLVLVNAIHFKANWAKKFDAAATVDAPFFIGRNEKITVKMMNMKGGKSYGFKHHDNLQAKILEMPYEGGEFRMVLILPDEIDGLSAVEEKLSSLNLTEEFNSLYPATVDIALPRFIVEETISLNDILKTLGIKSMFTGAANLSGISREQLSVSEVVQKAFIEVNEEGTEAAAATGMIAMMQCSILEPLTTEEFVADHPFVYIIVHTPTQLMLFVGSYRLPKSGAVMLRMRPLEETFNVNHPFIFMITHRKNSVLIIGKMAELGEGDSTDLIGGSGASSTVTDCSSFSGDDSEHIFRDRGPPESSEDVRCGKSKRR